MTVRELFEGIINNKIPSLDIVDTVEKLASKKGGVTKKYLDQMLSDFSIYLQKYVDMILNKRKSDTELIEEYQELKETDEVGVNFYLIQEYYDDAGLKVWQRDSILRFWTNIYNSIEHAEYLMSNKVTMRDSIGDQYRKGIPNSFFYEVYSQSLSELEVFSRVKELTDNFDPEKINLLCEDFDLYFHTEREFWLGDFSHEDIQNKIDEFEKKGKQIPTLGNRDQGGQVVSDYFKSKRILPKKKLTDEQEKKRDKFIQEMRQGMDKIIDERKLMDPLGLEFYSLYRLRNLLVKLKAEHTTAELKPEYQSKFDNSTPSQKIIENNIQPINWLKSKELLRQLIESLKIQELIEARETEDIINEHFRVDKIKPTKRVQPIVWLAQVKLLPYLMDQLSKERFIEVRGAKHKLTASHFVKESGEPLKSDSLGSMLSSLNKEVITDDYVVKKITTVLKTLR